MKFATVRQLRIDTPHLFEEMAEEPVIVTRRGKPIAALTAINEKTLEDFLKAVRSLHFRSTLKKLHAHAQKKSVDQLTMKEINKEIETVRRSH